MSDKIAVKFANLEAAEEADIQYYASLSYQERFEILISLIGHSEPSNGTVERCIRIYPITKSETD